MRSRYMLSALAACFVGGGLGCGSSLPAQADRERARQALSSALDAWKEGATSDSLQKKSPPIFVRDLDWSDGWKLKNYRFTLDDEQHGQQRRCYVHLTLQSPKGTAAAKEVQYLVATSPALVVLRVED